MIQRSQCLGFTGCIIFHDSLADTHLRCHSVVLNNILMKKVSYDQTGFVST